MRFYCQFNTVYAARILNISQFDKFSTFLKSALFEDISCFLGAQHYQNLIELIIVLDSPAKRELAGSLIFQILEGAGIPIHMG